MLDTLHALLADQVKDLYSAEKQLLKALPRLAKAACEPGLREALLSHLEETKTHATRLEDVADKLGIKPSGKVCKAMQGLIAEGAEVLEETGEDPVLDAAIIAAAQRVEHYEISAYGTARAFAEQLGKRDIAKMLQSTLDEERAADERLTEVCEGGILAAAMALNGRGKKE